MSLLFRWLGCRSEAARATSSGVGRFDRPWSLPRRARWSLLNSGPARPNGSRIKRFCGALLRCDCRRNQGRMEPRVCPTDSARLYPQYVWDQLPIGGSDDGSIMRLDQVFPVGADSSNWQLTSYRLSADAMTFIDEWFSWHVTGNLTSGGVLEIARSELAKL